MKSVIKKILVISTALSVYAGIFLLFQSHHTIIGNYTHEMYSRYIAPINFDYDESKTFDLAQTMSRKLEQSEKKNSFLQAQVDYYQNPTTLERPKPKVLLVAGHTQASPGTVFGGVTEYEVNYALMQNLATDLDEEGEFEVVTSHEGGDYSSMFTDYVDVNEKAIESYRTNLKKEYEIKYPQGVVTNDTNHNLATPKTALLLYGINKWAEDNDVDLVLHIHFNDYVRSDLSKPGEHTGFAVFVPVKTNRNFIESYRFAKTLERSLLKHFDRSTLKVESAGVLESELIAVGHFDALGVPSVLLEGGYIYEDHIQNPTLRAQAIKQYSADIHEALRTYFNIEK